MILCFFKDSIYLQVDHFSYSNDDVFNQRYLVNQQFWQNSKNGSGPIFFYAGNEGDITLFADNTVCFIYY